METGTYLTLGEAMTDVLQIRYNDIEALSPQQLVELVYILLLLETKKSGITSSAVNVPLKITVPDGGEDARVKWDGEPLRTNWLPNQFCSFQIKAEKNMSNADFKKAILVSQRRKEKDAPPSSPELKPKVAEVLDAGGCHIFVYGSHQVETQIQANITSIREGLRDAARNDAETASIQFYDANLIASWVNEFLPAIVQVLQWSTSGRYTSFQTWESWSRYDEHNVFSFVSDFVDEKVKQLRDYFCAQKKVARVIGLPGLGKSRLILEAFSTPDELTRQVVYLDASIYGTETTDKFRHLLLRDSCGIVVVDNCDLRTHHLLRKEVMRSDSQLSLLTIDFNPDEKTGGEADPVILVEESPEFVIKKMLEQVYQKTLPSEELSRIVQFAQGYPLMARLIAQARLEGKSDAGSLNHDELLQRLLWGRREPNEKAHEVISVCSLFSRLGFTDSAVEERHTVAAKLTKLSSDEFYSHAKDFIERRIIQVHGDFIVVVPKPLALRLAADWWKRCSPEKAKQLIENGLPPKLLEAMCEQIRMLDFLPEVQALTKSLCGDQGPFGKAEVLNSEMGSLLFRCFAEVNPEETIRALTKAFRSATRDDLLKIGPGRRNLIWALEKLCFWKTTFIAATSVLLEFACAENETWSNNATGQFIQLFQLFLPGTQASLSDRAEFLNLQMRDADETRQSVLIKAAAHAFATHHYSRSSMVEEQGSRPTQQDYHPLNGAEIHRYWEHCIEIIVKLACSENQEIAKEASEKFIGIIYSCITHHFLAQLKSAIQELCDCNKHLWTVILQRFDFAVRKSETEFSNEEQEIIQETYAYLNPKTLEENLSMWISNASWDYLTTDSNGKIINEAEEAIKNTARDFVEGWPAFKTKVDLLLKGEQRNAFMFGGLVIDAGIDHRELFDQSAAALRSIPANEANPTFLAGVLARLKEKQQQVVDAYLDELAESPQTSRYLAQITALISPTATDLNRLIGKLSEIPSKELERLSYGSALANITVNDLVNFVNALIQHDRQNCWSALTILYMYSLNDHKKQTDCLSAFERVLESISLSDTPELTSSELHLWESATTICLRNGSTKIANYALNEITSLCQSLNFRGLSRHRHSLVKIIRELISPKYFESVWPTLSNLLVSEEGLKSENLKYLIAEPFKGPSEDPGILFSIDLQVLLDWAKDNPKAAQLIARLTPTVVHTVTEGTNIRGELDPFLMKLIDQNGDDTEVLKTILRNMDSFVWSGSLSPLFAARIEAFTPLETHANEKVRSWARDVIEFTKKRLEHEQKIDAQERAGIFER